MAPRNPVANLSFTVDSASEDEIANDVNTFPTPDSNTENKAPTRKPRGKAAQKTKAAPPTKVTAKGRPATRRASGNSVLAVNKATAGVTKKAKSSGSRQALAERHRANGSDTEEVDEFDGEEEVDPAPIPAKSTRKAGRPKGKKVAEEIEEVEEAPAPAKKTRKTSSKDTQAKPTAKKSSKRVKELEPEPEAFTIPETQAEPELDPMDIEESIEFDEIPESMPPPPRPLGRPIQQQSRIARQTSAGARRAGSVSDSERDPALRRKLGEITRKLEAMTTKYDNLKEVASSGKDSNFEQLKRRTDQTIKDQDAVIKALKQQISEMQSRTSDLYSMKKDMARLEKENTRMITENKKLNESLTSTQNENKTLSTKLAAARSSAPPEGKNIPGSAVKARSTGVVLPGTAEAAKEAQLQKQKVDLYSDLTNLVLLGMKRNEDEEDVYDCLQTGRNGTLHFHLTVASGSDSYEDTEFVYQPLLNEQRDKELLDLLPDYLTEEICFPRGQAAKFYMKVVDSMSKKIVLEDD